MGKARIYQNTGGAFAAYKARETKSQLDAPFAEPVVISNGTVTIVEPGTYLIEGYGCAFLMDGDIATIENGTLRVCRDDGEYTEEVVYQNSDGEVMASEDTERPVFEMTPDGPRVRFEPIPDDCVSVPAEK